MLTHAEHLFETPLAIYYRELGRAYDAIYYTPRWADNLQVLKVWLTEHTKDRVILEVAAGSGYWTAVAASVARYIIATDCNQSLLSAAARRCASKNVNLIVADAHALPHPGHCFDLGMAHMWWSHVEVSKQHQFLSRLSETLYPGSKILMIDQNPPRTARRAPSSSKSAPRQDRTEDRILANGRKFNIIKNYPTDRDLKDVFATVCDDIQIVRLDYFWALSARTRPITP